MINKNRYLYYSILPCLLLLITIGVYVSGYNPPTCNPPGCNLPAPINAGLDPQTKAGNLTIQGNLTTGGFTMSAGAGADKVLTTDASGIASWQTAGGGWDGVLPNYTTAQRNALSLADGLIVFNTTDNAVQIYKSDAWANVGAKLSLAATCSLDGDCDSTHCVDEVCCNTACSGTVCQTCGSLSSAGLGYCGYVNNSSNDPRNTCATASPPAADSCKSPNCSGTGYSCGYLTGEQNQPTCKRCSGSSHDPINITTGSQDTEGSNLCTATHYRCNGGGACIILTTPFCIHRTASNCNTTCSDGYDGCTCASNYAACDLYRRGCYYDDRYCECWRYTY